MRVKELPGFTRKIEIPDLHNFIRTRLSQTVVMWPEQAIPLLGYMCYPNDGEAREDFVLTLRSWPEASEDDPPMIPVATSHLDHLAGPAVIFGARRTLAKGSFRVLVRPS
jgi:hypothetical protein